MTITFLSDQTFDCRESNKQLFKHTLNIYNKYYITHTHIHTYTQTHTHTYIYIYIYILTNITGYLIQ